MLIKLNNELIMKHWEVFKDTLRRSNPDTLNIDPTRFIDMLDKALVGQLQCWLCFPDAEIDTEATAAGCTQVMEDPISGERTLLIYAFASWKDGDSYLNHENFKTLSTFARDMRCKTISFYVSDMRFAKVIKEFYPHKAFEYIRLEV